MIWISYQTTRDDPIGVPGFGDEFFAAVRRRANHTTLWRAISLRIHAHEAPPAPRGVFGGIHQEITNV